MLDKALLKELLDEYLEIVRSNLSRTNSFSIYPMVYFFVKSGYILYVLIVCRENLVKKNSDKLAYACFFFGVFLLKTDYWFFSFYFLFYPIKWLSYKLVI